MFLFNIASVLTGFRFLVGVFFALFGLDYLPPFMSLGLVALACLSDALDGMVARYLDQTSSWGSVLDPLADASLLMGLCLALYQASRISIAFMAIQAVRYFCCLIYYLDIPSTYYKPLWIGKMYACCLMVVVLFWTYLTLMHLHHEWLALFSLVFVMCLFLMSWLAYYHRYLKLRMLRQN